MSVLFNCLEVGHEIQMKGPLGSFTWLGKCEALWKGNKVKPGSLGFICGGSGWFLTLFCYTEVNF
jgi:hypothetical protein